MKEFSVVLLRRFSLSWQLLLSSLRFFGQNVDLVWLPVISISACLIWVAVGIAGALFLVNTVSQPMTQGQLIAGLLGSILFYFVMTCIVLFFNVVLLHCSIERLQGRQGDLRSGFQLARSRWQHIIAWAIMSALVGGIIHLLERSHRVVGEIIALLLSGTWTIGTYFGLPIMIVEGVGPLTALKKSFGLFGKSWRRIIGVNLILALPFLVLFLLLFIVGHTVPALDGRLVFIAGIAILLCIVLFSTFGATLNAVVRCALFVQNYHEQPPKGFDTNTLSAAPIMRRQRRI